MPQTTPKINLNLGIFNFCWFLFSVIYEVTAQWFLTYVWFLNHNFLSNLGTNVKLYSI